MTTPTFKQFKQAAEEAGYEIRSYSGRFMYGEKCVGIVHSESAAAVAFKITLALVSQFGEEWNDKLDNGEVDDTDYSAIFTTSRLCDFERVFTSAREDSMGLDSIVYFTRLKWEDYVIDENDKATLDNPKHWEIVVERDLKCDIEEDGGVLYAFNDKGEVLGEWDVAGNKGWHLIIR